MILDIDCSPFTKFQITLLLAHSTVAVVLENPYSDSVKIMRWVGLGKMFHERKWYHGKKAEKNNKTINERNFPQTSKKWLETSLKDVF